MFTDTRGRTSTSIAPITTTTTSTDEMGRGLISRTGRGLTPARKISLFYLSVDEALLLRWGWLIPRDCDCRLPHLVLLLSVGSLTANESAWYRRETLVTPLNFFSLLPHHNFARLKVWKWFPPSLWRKICKPLRTMTFQCKRAYRHSEDTRKH